MFSIFKKKIYENVEIIKYENLFYIDKKFIFITDNKNIEIEKINLRNDLKNNSKFKPDIKFINIQNINDFIIKNNVEIINDITLLATHDYNHNVAHALFDVLYPLYLIYLIFNSKITDNKFNIFLNLITNGLKRFKGNCSREYNLDIFKKFSKGELFIETQVKKNFCFKKLICGIGGAGLSFLNKNGVMPGKNIFVLEKFRNRMMDVYNIKYPIKSKKIKIGIVMGGRFNNNDINILKKICEENNNTETECIIIDYSKLPSFRDQLILFSTINIHLSHPGTAMFNFVYLNDNSIHVNLGCIYKNYPTFLESNICALSNNILVQYYNIHKYKKIFYEPLNYILQESINTIKINNGILVNKLPLFIKIWQEFCKKDPKVIDLIEKWGRGKISCRKMGLCSRWPDGIINEYRGFTKKDNRINNKLLQDIKKKYNI